MDEMYEALRGFANHYTDNIPEIPVVQHVPTACEFLSHYVLPNKPFIIRCPENHLPAVSRWNERFYLDDHLYDEVPTTCVIPNYRASPIVWGNYMVPEIRKKPCYSILLELQKRWQKHEYYYVKQPNNLHEFQSIADDIRPDVPWATEALDSDPIAANLSFGNVDNFTMLHNDEYDNFFYVIRGKRRFILIPPIACLCLPRKTYKKFQWKKSLTDEERFDMIDLNEEIEIIPRIEEDIDYTRGRYYRTLGDVEPETLEQQGFYRNIKKYEVEIHPGDALYIPALWYHEYFQSDYTFTLNYWYDVKRGLKDRLFDLVTKLFELKKPSMFKDVALNTQTEFEKSLIDKISNELYQMELSRK